VSFSDTAAAGKRQDYNKMQQNELQCINREKIYTIVANVLPVSLSASDWHDTGLKLASKRLVESSAEKALKRVFSSAFDAVETYSV